MVVREEAIFNEPRQLPVAVSGTDVELSPSRAGKKARIAFSLTPTTAGTVVSFAFSNSAAVLNSGVVLVANQPYVESANTVEDAYRIVWQGPIHAIASAAGNVAVMERFEP
jgi:hypothetical protein